jgi:hypothetical protein
LDPKRVVITVLAFLLNATAFGLLFAQTAPSRSTGWFWSVGAVRQVGPDDQLFRGVRFVRLGYDDTGHPPLGVFFGGEQLVADRCRLGRAFGGMSLLLFHLGSHASAWIYPTAGVDFLWGQPDDGLGASAGFGAEFIVRPRQTSQVAVSCDRYFSTVAGTRGQVSLVFRWGVMQVPRTQP